MPRPDPINEPDNGDVKEEDILQDSDLNDEIYDDPSEEIQSLRESVQRLKQSQAKLQKYVKTAGKRRRLQISESNNSESDIDTDVNFDGPSELYIEGYLYNTCRKFNPNVYHKFMETCRRVAHNPGHCWKKIQYDQTALFIDTNPLRVSIERRHACRLSTILGQLRHVFISKNIHFCN